MRKSNTLKKLLVIANTLIIGCLIALLILKTDFMYSLYWVLVPFLIVIIVAFIREIDKGQMDSDIDKSKIVKRSYNDISTVATVIYIFAYLIILFIEQITKKAYQNIYVIIGFLVLTFIYEMFLYLSIYNAKKETSEILNKKK